jgi:hypothetical protein
MNMYVLTEGIGTGRMAIVSSATGDRFEFPRADGGLLAVMLDDEFPACQGCEDRDDVCGDCGMCPECRDDQCAECAEFEDYEDEEGTCDNTAEARQDSYRAYLARTGGDPAGVCTAWPQRPYLQGGAA